MTTRVIWSRGMVCRQWGARNTELVKVREAIARQGSRRSWNVGETEGDNWSVKRQWVEEGQEEWETVFGEFL